MAIKAGAVQRPNAFVVLTIRSSPTSRFRFVAIARSLISAFFFGTWSTRKEKRAGTFHEAFLCRDMKRSCTFDICRIDISTSTYKFLDAFRKIPSHSFMQWCNAVVIDTIHCIEGSVSVTPGYHVHL